MHEHSWSRITPAIIALQTHATFLKKFRKVPVPGYKLRTEKIDEAEKWVCFEKVGENEIQIVISIFVILLQSELIQKWDRELEEIQIVLQRPLRSVSNQQR